jgi:opacity protein-like surface antigen
MLFATIALSVSAVSAQDAEQSEDNSVLQYIGVRIGLFHTTSTDESVFVDLPVTSSIGSNAISAEFFYNYFFLDQIGFEIILGSISRGDIEFVDDSSYRLLGSANVYPIAIGLKLTPLSGITSRSFQPYIHGGGSLVVTRELYESGQLAGQYNDLYAFGSRSETDFGWWAGGGLESFVSSSVCITSDFKYQSIKHGEYIAGYKDHSGYQITFGVGYIFRKR